jgi:hypothetical protein
MTNTPIPPVVQVLIDGHVLHMAAGDLACRWFDRVKGDPRTPGNLRIVGEAGRIANLATRIAERKHPLLQLWLDHGHRPGMREIGLAPVAPASVPASRAKLHAASGLTRGWLRHGNPSGDFRASPRCGARTRSGGCCRQPAMANGCCRMHGGLSTGPRTTEGLRRSRHSRYVHGFRSQPVLDLRRRCVRIARDLTGLTAAARLALRSADSLLRAAGKGQGGGILAGHGVHRPDFESHVGAALRPASAIVPVTRRADLCSSVSIRGSNPEILAGHGVHRPDFPRDRMARRLAAAC